MWTSALRSTGDALELHHEGPMVPSPRSSVASALIGAATDDPAMVIFGGVGAGCSYHDVYALQLRSQSWLKWVTTGSCPTECAGAGSSLFRQRYLYIFGGRQHNTGDVTNQLHRLDTHQRRWSVSLPLGHLPDPRDDCVMIASEYQRSDGSDSGGGSLLARPHGIDIGSSLSSSATSMVATYDWEVHGSLLVYGGANSQRQPIGDMWCYSISQNLWRQVLPVGDVPPDGLAAASAARLCDGDRRVAIFGGYTASSFSSALYILDTGTFCFTRVNVTAAVPRPRTHCSSVTYCGHLFIFGGYHQCEALDDVWTIDLLTAANRKGMSGPGSGGPPFRHWSLIASSAAPPRGAAAMAVDPVDGVAFIFGGCDGFKFLSSTTMLRLASPPPPSDSGDYDGGRRDPLASPAPPRRGGVSANSDLPSESPLLSRLDAALGQLRAQVMTRRQDDSLFTDESSYSRRQIPAPSFRNSSPSRRAASPPSRLDMLAQEKSPFVAGSSASGMSSTAKRLLGGYHTKAGSAASPDRREQPTWERSEAIRRLV